MAKKAGQIVVSLSAGTATFIADMDKANAKLKQFGLQGQQSNGHMVSSMASSSAAIRTLEGNFTNNIRAAERFIGLLPGMSKLVSAAFPLVGAIAFGGVLYEMGVKAEEFIKKFRTASEAIGGSFNLLAAPLRLTNDELRVANDRLANDIAKLEGHRQNTLKLALDEARVAADKLADSLERDVSGLYKLFKEQSIFGLSDIEKNLGGETGLGGFGAQLSKVARSGGPDSDKRVVAMLDDQMKRVQAQIDKRKSSFKSMQDEGLTLPGDKGPQNQIDMLTNYQGQLQLMRDRVGLQGTNTALTAKKEALAAGAENAAAIRPYSDKLKQLDAQLEEIRLKSSGIGANADTQTRIAGYANAVKAVQELNKAMERHHTHLSEQQMDEIRAKEATNALADAEESHKAKMQGLTESTAQRISVTNQLTAAIGKGYEATKKAVVETQVMQALGRDYADPKFVGDASRLRGQFGGAFDADHKKSVDEAVDKLGSQIELERSLAKVQREGAEAIRLVTLAYRLRDIATRGGLTNTREQIAAEIQMYDSQRETASKGRLAGTERQIEAIRRLGAAELISADAARRMGLELKYEQMQRDNVKSTEITAERTKDISENYREIRNEALRVGMASRNQLELLDQQIEIVRKVKAEQGDSLAIQMSLRDLENQRLKVLTEQALSTGKARDAMRAFWLDMHRESKRTGDILYEAMHSAVDGVSSSLAKLITGQKAGFGGMVKGIGDQIVGSVVKKGIEKGIDWLGTTKIGKKIGLGSHAPTGSKPDPFWVRSDDFDKNLRQPGPYSGCPDDSALSGAKPDGTQANPVWVRIVDQTAQQQPADPGIFDMFIAPLIQAIPAGAGGLGKGSASSPIPRAGGGPVSASDAYLVGEHGPEILTGASGRIMDANSSRRVLNGGGSNVYYSIDARGTDPAQTEARVRQALIAVHGSAISTSIQATADLQKRTPQK